MYPAQRRRKQDRRVRVHGGVPMRVDSEHVYLRTVDGRVEPAQRVRGKKLESYLADDYNFPEFAKQLRGLGLALRDIPADGNCLFRALGDQLEGHCRNHFRHRQDVAHYMIEHRRDFEPFVLDDTPFELYLDNLRKLGVYAGNDAIVAFAQLHQVNIFIHQLNSKNLMITGSPNQSAKQLHIAYHNGDHYSSIRRENDNTESPACIKLLDDSKDSSLGVDTSDLQVFEGCARANRGFHDIEEEVMAATCCKDRSMVRRTLSDCDYDADATIAHLLQLLELTSGETENHINDSNEACASTTIDYGHKVLEESCEESSGYGSLRSNSTVQTVPSIQNGYQGMSSKKKKKEKKAEKKSRARERRKQTSSQNLQEPELPAPVYPVHSSVTRI